MELATPLCGRLGIRYPIFCAGMSAVAGPELVAAVSNAGGLGVLGAAGADGAGIRKRMAEVRVLTSAPVGVNLIIAGVETDEERQYIRDEITAAADGGASVVVLFWGDPAPYVDLAHQLGLLLFVQVGSVDEGRAAADAGVDAVIAQGVEAGGHVRGTSSVWDLLPAMTAAIAPTAVVASGGIGDSNGLARALHLGAQAVSLGTRFLATDEAYVHPDHKRRVVESTAADTWLGNLFDVWWPDAPHRVLRTRLVSDWEAADCPPPGRRAGESETIGTVTRSSGEKAPWPRYAVGIAGPDYGGDIDDVPLWAGESCEVINDIKPAADVIADLVREAGARDDG